MKCKPPSDVEYVKVAEYDYENFQREAYPFSATNPLLFHVLTGAPEGIEGERYALDLVRQGVELMPAADVPGMKGLVRARDRVAGDDRFVFLTPLTTFGASESITAVNRQDVGRPAFAFDAATLWDASKNGFQFRVRDLEEAYANIEPPEAPWEWREGIDDDEWEAMSYSQLEDAMDEARAEAVREDLECMAEAGTITGDDAWEALMIYAQRAGGLISAQEAQAAGQPLIPEPPDEDWCPEAAEIARRWELRERWLDMFWGLGDPQATIFGSRANKPEVLYPGTIPLCCATWFRRGNGEWVRLDPALCEQGRAASNPRKRHVTTARPQR